MLGVIVPGFNAASQQTLLLSLAPHPIQCQGEVTSILYWGSQQSWGSMLLVLLQNILLPWLSLIYGYCCQNKVYQGDKFVLQLSFIVLLNRTIFTKGKNCSTGAFESFLVQNILLLWISLIYGYCYQNKVYQGDKFVLQFRSIG